MSQGKSSSRQNELYFYTEHDGSASVTTTRVYFTKTLEAADLNYIIRPGIMDGVRNKDLIGSVTGYPNYIAIRWLHIDVVLGKATLRELEEEITQTADRVLTNAFDWKSSVVRVLSSNTEVRNKAAELGVDWLRGRTPL